MKIKLPVIILLLSLTACSEDEYRTVVEVRPFCDTQSKEERAEFILQCLKNANPKSDEEPEIWVHLCPEMAEELFCDVKSVKIRQVKPANSYWRDTNIIEIQPPTEDK